MRSSASKAKQARQDVPWKPSHAAVGRRTVAAGFLLGAMLSAAVLGACAQPTEHTAQNSFLRQIQQGLALAQKGDVRGAMAIADRLLAERPNSVAAVKLKALVLEESGQQTEAAAEYERGLNLAPNDPDLLLKAGAFRLAAGHPSEALEALARCVRLVPRDGDAQFYVAQAYHLNGEDQLALKAMSLAARLEPNNSEILQKYGELLGTAGDSQQALALLTRARALNPSLPRIDYDLGLAEYKLMALPEAAQFLKEEKQKDPENADAIALLGTVQLRLNHWPEAKAALTQFLVAHPDDVESLLGLGHCQVELNENDAAVTTLQHVLQLDPTQLIAHFYLSRAYAALGRTDESRHEAELHHQMMEKVTFARSRETEQREQEITPEARQLLTEGQELAAIALYRKQFPRATDADARAFVGKTYLYMGKPEVGVNDVEGALQMDPKVRGAHTTLGILALSRADFVTAEQQFQAEIANDPNAQDAIAEMGEVRYRQGRWEEAARYLEQSKTMTPELLFLLTDAYFRTGKVDEACTNAELVAAYGHQNRQLMQDLIALLMQNEQMQTAKRIREELSF